MKICLVPTKKRDGLGLTRSKTLFLSWLFPLLQSEWADKAQDETGHGTRKCQIYDCVIPRLCFFSWYGIMMGRLGYIIRNCFGSRLRRYGIWQRYAGLYAIDTLMAIFAFLFLTTLYIASNNDHFNVFFTKVFYRWPCEICDVVIIIYSSHLHLVI